MDKVSIFVIAGSLLQFKDYCRCKEFRPVQKSVWEDKEGNKVRYASNKHDLQGRNIKKLIYIGNYWDSSVLGFDTVDSLARKLNTDYEFDYY